MFNELINCLKVSHLFAICCIFKWKIEKDFPVFITFSGADPEGGKRGLSHGQIFEIVIFSITWSYYINASQTF